MTGKRRDRTRKESLESLVIISETRYTPENCARGMAMPLITRKSNGTAMLLINWTNFVLLNFYRFLIRAID
jgi:hypothetical protein